MTFKCIFFTVHIVFGIVWLHLEATIIKHVQTWTSGPGSCCISTACWAWSGQAYSSGNWRGS